MDVAKIEMDPFAARIAYRKYLGHCNYQQPVDREIRRCYRAIGNGQLVIKAIDSIHRAGLNEQGLPKLAICRADAQVCHLGLNRGAVSFSMIEGWHRQNEHHSRTIRVPWPGVVDHWQGHVAIVPLIPVDLRPRRGIENYHILFEAEWTRVVPRDPMLLRRLSAGDTWLVVAHWDLSEVERAVLQGRL